MVWLEGDPTYGIPVRRYAWRSPHGGWGASREVPGSPDAQLAIGMSSFGDATVAYGLPSGQIVIATARPGEPLMPRETLTGSPPILQSFTPQVALAVDDEGGATVAWVSTPKTFVATRRPGGRFGEPQMLDRDGGFNIGLAVNPAGGAVVTWGRGSEAVRAAYRLPGETRFGAAENVPRASNWLGAPMATINAEGTAVLASSGRTPIGPTGVTFSARPELGKFGPEQRVDSRGELHALVAEPQGATSFISNVQQPHYETGATTVTTRSSTGALGSPTLLGDADSCYPHAAANALGQLVVAYSRPCGHRVQVRRRDGAGAAFDAPAVVGTEGAVYPRVAVSPSGDAIVAYTQNSPSGGAVIASVAYEDPAAGVKPVLRPTIGGGQRPVVTLPPDGSSVGLPIICPRACTVLPQGIITTDGTARARSTNTHKRRLRTRQRARVGVRFSKARLRQARRALRRGDRATVSYTVTVRRRGAIAGLSFSRSVRLRLPR